MNNSDWEAIASLLQTTSPDAYHFGYATGATEHQIGLGKYRGPNGTDTPWDTYDAYCQHYAYPSDRIALESLVFGLVRGIQKITKSFLDQPSREVHGKHGIETVGNDLYNEGVLAAVEVIGKRREFDHVGPDDLDEVTQLRRIVFCAARNRMLDFLERMYPEWWRKTLCAGLPEDDELFEEDGSPRRSPVTESATGVESSDPTIAEAAHSRAQAAIDDACSREADKAIVELRENGHSQEEIADIVGLSRNQVQRALTRIQKKAEDQLGLPNAKAKKRKRRKK
jgi:RNA polymerase sigma factor (sigma-70 family)